MHLSNKGIALHEPFWGKKFRALSMVFCPANVRLNHSSVWLVAHTNHQLMVFPHHYRLGSGGLWARGGGQAQSGRYPLHGARFLELDREDVDLET